MKEIRETMSGFPDDVFAAVWHARLSDDDIRANLPASVRDKRAGRHDVRMLVQLTSLHDRKRHIPTLDDLAQGIGKRPDVGRIAVITDDPMFRLLVQFFGPFFHSAIRVFGNAESEQARSWLKAYETT
jgi:hypothetical protein